MVTWAEHLTLNSRVMIYYKFIPFKHNIYDKKKGIKTSVIWHEYSCYQCWF